MNTHEMMTGTPNQTDPREQAMVDVQEFLTHMLATMKNEGKIELKGAAQAELALKSILFFKQILLDLRRTGMQRRSMRGRDLDNLQAALDRGSLNPQAVLDVKSVLDRDGLRSEATQMITEYLDWMRELQIGLNEVQGARKEEIAGGDHERQSFIADQMKFWDYPEPPAAN
jgi:hypothetical protein